MHVKKETWFVIKPSRRGPKGKIVVSCVLMAAKIFVFRSHEIVTKAFYNVMVLSPTSSFSPASKWRSAELPCGLASYSLSLLAIIAPGQSYVRKVAHLIS